MEIKLNKTDRGFKIGEFIDKYGQKCSIQESSLASEPCIWLGMETGNHDGRTGGCMSRMHLTREMAAELIPLLENFVKTGGL